MRNANLKEIDKQFKLLPIKTTKTQGCPGALATHKGPSAAVLLPVSVMARCPDTPAHTVHVPLSIYVSSSTRSAYVCRHAERVSQVLQMQEDDKVFEVIEARAEWKLLLHGSLA